MAKELAPSEVERRKQVRLRLRGDLDITPQKYEGKTYYVVKDPVSLRYYRFKDQEHYLLRLMDGKHTLDDAQKEFEKEYRPDRLTLEDLEHFGQQLLTAGLAQNESPGAGKALFDRRKKRKRQEWLQTFTNVLYIKIPIFDPEYVLKRMLPWFRFMFTAWFLALSVGVMLGALLLVATHFTTFYNKLPSYQEFFSFKTVVYLWAALAVVKVIHEFGHGLSCKAFGGEVHEMGFLFLCFSPAMYCNVSDAWTLPNKWHRIIISGAGIYVELMIAAIATFVWWNSPGQPFVNYMSLSLMVVCSVSTVMFNGNPLMRYDGYYVLADWLEIPNLRDRANRYLQRVVMEHCLGMEVQPEPYMALWRRVLFVVYAVIAYVYRWVITFVILTFMATFLKPYKLEIISTLLAAAAAGSMIGWPLFRMCKNLNRRGWRPPEMKRVRVVISSLAVAVVVLAFFLLPLPVSRVRESGVIQVESGGAVPVNVAVSGVLEKVHVTEGQEVTRGAELATFSSLELKQQEDEARAEYLIQEKLVQAYTALMTNDEAPPDSPRARELQTSKAKAEGERDKARGKWLQLQRHVRERLTVRATATGRVMGVPQPDDLGKYWEKGQSKPICTIAASGTFWVLVPLTPDDYSLVRENLERKRQRKEVLEVTVRVQGRGPQTWEGKVVHLPASEAKEIPLSLSTKAGGPLAVKPSEDPNKVVPQNQVFLVGVEILRPDAAIRPGQMAQVKIHNEYKSCAWFVWRFLSKTFDIGLL